LEESGFDEAGVDELSLIMGNRSTESLVSDLGFRLNRFFEMDSGVFTPELSAAWNYDFRMDDQLIAASFAGFPDASFSIKGREEEAHGLVLGAALNFLSKSGASSSLKYSEELREGYRVREVSGEIRFEF
jgi:uncharacterized protein YhjY with autotransporter beta-barrel domain